MIRRSLLLSSILIGSSIALASCSEQPERKTTAVVVNIAPHPGAKWHPGESIVTARSQDGAIGTKTIPTSRLACRVGDVVPASARGVALTLHEKACER